MYHHFISRHINIIIGLTVVTREICGNIVCVECDDLSSDLLLAVYQVLIVVMVMALADRCACCIPQEY